ncbi:MAG: DUF1232 domain-containing protein [Candidatus Gracilibacteria bacterium]
MKFFQKIKNISSIVREIKILYLAYTDKRTPLSTKIVAGVFSGAYLLYFLDLIPDFLPVIGILDDIVIIPLIAAFISRWIPQDILDEARKLIVKNEQK